MKIVQIDGSEAARLVPLSAVVQALHAAERPDVFHKDAGPDAVAGWFADWLTGESRFALLAEVEGAAVGYLLGEVQTVTETAMNRARVRGFVHHIAVAEDVRRQGVATALIEAAKARFRAADATIWATSYWTFNAASEALMCKLGARPAIILADGAL